MSEALWLVLAVLASGKSVARWLPSTEHLALTTDGQVTTSGRTRVRTSHMIVPVWFGLGAWLVAGLRDFQSFSLQYRRLLRFASAQ